MGQRIRCVGQPGAALLTDRRMGEFESLPADWLSYEDALSHVLNEASPMPTAQVRTWNAFGRSLAEPIRARAHLPAWPNSAMDGFAARSEDLTAAPTPITMPVAGASYPGSVPLEDVPRGAVVRIMTGGAVPLGFDTVIRVEHTDGEESPGWVVIRHTDDLGKHVRGAGNDMTVGEETVGAGTIVHSGSVAVILASGHDPVTVYRRPRVGVLSSGDELVGPDRFDRVIAGRAVPDTNRAMIAAGVREAGGVPVDLGVADDDPESLRDRLASVPDVDVLVTTGGASMGERDLLKRILLDMPFRLGFWRARVRPGSPISFGHLRREGRDLPVFGLPGNPASAFVTFHVFVVPYVRACLGSPRPRGTAVAVRTEAALASPEQLTQFYRVTLHGPARGGRSRWARCALTGPQGSGLVRSLRDAEGLAIVPEGVARIRKNDPVAVMLLPGAR